MNLSRLTDVYDINPGADEKILQELDQKLQIPRDFRSFLSIANGLMFDNGIKIYSTDDIIERNETLETAKYASGYLAIGDDSGGQCILMSLITGEIGKVDIGSMKPKYMDLLADSFQEWIDNNCQVE